MSYWHLYLLIIFSMQIEGFLVFQKRSNFGLFPGILNIMSCTSSMENVGIVLLVVVN